MTNELKTSFDATWGCWIAYINDCPDNSGSIGEGSTREAAVADYWYQIHDGKTASLMQPDAYNNCWRLFDGVYVIEFDSREEAVAYGEAHQYITSPFVKEV